MVKDLEATASGTAHDNVAYQQNVTFLAECIATVTDLRDKAYFSNLDDLGAALERARATADTLRNALIENRAGPDADARAWIDRTNGR